MCVFPVCSVQIWLAATLTLLGVAVLKLCHVYIDR